MLELNTSHQQLRSYGDETLVLKSHSKDLRSLGSNSRPLVYKARSLTTTEASVTQSTCPVFGYTYKYDAIVRMLSDWL